VLINSVKASKRRISLRLWIRDFRRVTTPFLSSSILN